MGAAGGAGLFCGIYGGGVCLGPRSPLHLARQAGRDRSGLQGAWLEAWAGQMRGRGDPGPRWSEPWWAGAWPSHPGQRGHTPAPRPARFQSRWRWRRGCASGRAPCSARVRDLRVGWGRGWRAGGGWGASSQASRCRSQGPGSRARPSGGQDRRPVAASDDSGTSGCWWSRTRPQVSAPRARELGSPGLPHARLACPAQRPAGPEARRHAGAWPASRPPSRFPAMPAAQGQEWRHGITPRGADSGSLCRWPYYSPPGFAVCAPASC